MSLTGPHNGPESDGHDHPGVEPDSGLGDLAARVMAIEELMTGKGLIEHGEVQSMADRVDSRSPADGARAVAKAWVDPEFKARLLADPMGAIRELGYEIPTDMPRLDVVENTESVHHMVVCTLCSCYPRALLGRPPQWYKSLAYRSRAVADPRGVMSEFGSAVSDDVEVRVLDSTADIRFLVLPRRPDGTEEMTEEELTRLVTRDSMIGVSDPLAPASQVR